MFSRVRRALFREPSGRPHTLVAFGGALVLSVLLAYGHAVGTATFAGLFVVAAGFALSGTAEALPAGRRRTAGCLRVVAILLMVCLIGSLAFAPERVV